MRFPRVSLAAKYRLLFGCAVVLIIAATLAVPWYTLEVLLQQQPYREAQSIVESFHRHELPGGVGSNVHAGKFSLMREPGLDRARFIPLDREPPKDPNASESFEKFVSGAAAAFRERPTQESYYRNEWTPGGRVFRYAHAVWISRRCLNCHDAGRGATAYRENQLAGLLTVELPSAQAGPFAPLHRTVLLAAGALAGILAILVFYVITTRFILAPVHDLRSVTLRVADGDLTARSTMRTGDEFEQLGANFNTMLERLRDSQDELRRANRLLDEKLGEMAETNVSLFESNRLKSEFLANVSHELRTPLTSIIGFAELLREGAASADARVQRYAEHILISGRILLEIINDLLDLAKIEANKLELRLEPVQIEEVCRTLVEFMRPLADKKSIELDVRSEAELPALSTDRGRVRQVLFNLLSNAIKFTPEGGRVWIRAGPGRDGRVRIEVQDTGPGVAPEFHETIFEKFRQMDQSVTREHAGTGLGLAIAKELMFLLGGEIGVESEMGGGATFWIELPRAAPASPDRVRPTFV